MPIRSRILAILPVFFLAGAVVGCGDTWQGLKKDTGDNMKATGEALEAGGEKIKK